MWFAKTTPETLMVSLDKEPQLATDTADTVDVLVSLSFLTTEGHTVKNRIER